MDTSSSFAPFTFVLHRPALGSEHSCFWPARKLHLKLALWSEWLISHLTSMQVNERSKETASPLLYNHHRHVSHPSTDLQESLVRLQPMVTRKGQPVMLYIVWRKESKMGAGVCFLWTPVHVQINPRSFFFCLFLILHL